MAVRAASATQFARFFALIVEFVPKSTKELQHVQISVSVRHGHLSEASQEKLKTKAEKFGRIFERLTAIELVVDLKDEQSPEVAINVSAEHKHDFVAHATAESLLSAFDSAAAKIEQQLRKYKERVVERHRGPGSKHVEIEPAVVDELED
jgi:putative sigma-54 modulation protein